MKKHALLSLLLALALVFSLLPGTVLADGYEVTVTPSTSSVTPGSKISLSATVKIAGETISDSDLENRGLFLWWWVDSWNEHDDGNSDASFSNYDNNSGHSLTADVTLPSEGTYYIIAELKDSSNNSLFSACATFTVEANQGTTPTPVESDLYVPYIDGTGGDFIRGVDVSSLLSELKSGVRFKDWEGKSLGNTEDAPGINNTSSNVMPSPTIF